MNSAKAIILLQPHEPNQEPLLSYCNDNNFTVIKTIIADDEDDYRALNPLIHLINSQNKPVNLIVTSNSLDKLFHIFTYTVIATLLEANLISSLYIYQGKTSQAVSAKRHGKTSTASGKEWLEIKNNLLPFCAEYYKAMILVKEMDSFYDNEQK